MRGTRFLYSSYQTLCFLVKRICVVGVGLWLRCPQDLTLLSASTESLTISNIFIKYEDVGDNFSFFLNIGLEHIPLKKEEEKTYKDQISKNRPPNPTPANPERPWTSFC